MDLKGKEKKFAGQACWIMRAKYCDVSEMHRDL